MNTSTDAEAATEANEAYAGVDAGVGADAKADKDVDAPQTQMLCMGLIGQKSLLALQLAKNQRRRGAASHSRTISI